MPSHEETQRRQDRRLEKYALCKIFVDLAADWFPAIAKRDPRHALLADTYDFYVTPGDREGGDGSRLLDVSYVPRPIEPVAEMSPPRTCVTEAGASLSYRRTGRGAVLCLLEPARSHGFERPEGAIVLAHIRQPRVLTGKSIIERHWRSLISYFEFSSIGGDPALSDQLRVWWLLFTRPLVIDGKIQPPRIVQVGGQMLKWVVTIGLSGALLAAAGII